MPEDFVSAVAVALSHSNPRDVIEGVKSVVRDELNELDPAAKIEDTEYFNHTYVPDFVVSWGSGRKARHREVYLRNSIESPTLRYDVEKLDEMSPVLLALRPADGDEIKVPADKKFRRALRRADRALVTDVSVVEGLSDARSSASRSPLAPILGSGLLRGGRGYLDQERAEVLQAGARPAEGESPPELTEEFFETVSRHFEPEAALQVSRAAGILRWAFAPEFAGLAVSEAGAQLSDEEIEAILPFVLKSANATADPDFWRYLGSMISLDRLSQMRLSLSDLDLTKLIVPNLPFWTGTRALVVDGPEVDQLEEVDFGWRFQANVLSAVFDTYRVFLGNDGRMLRGKGDSKGAARWQDLDDLVGKFELREVALQGVARSLRMSATTSRRTRGDVETALQTFKDSFVVPEIVVEAAPVGDKPPGNIALNFPERAAQTAGDVSLQDLVTVALSFFGYRRPVAGSTLSRYLTGDEV